MCCTFCGLHSEKVQCQQHLFPPNILQGFNGFVDLLFAIQFLLVMRAVNFPSFMCFLLSLHIQTHLWLCGIEKCSHVFSVSPFVLPTLKYQPCSPISQPCTDFHVCEYPHVPTPVYPYTPPRKCSQRLDSVTLPSASLISLFVKKFLVDAFTPSQDLSVSGCTPVQVGFVIAVAGFVTVAAGSVGVF